MKSDGEPLSARGEARRREILETALRAARRQRWRRRGFRGAAAVVLCALTGMLVIRWNRPAVEPSMVAQRPQQERGQVRVQYVQDEPGIARRLAAPESKMVVEYLNDERLLELLASEGHSAGIVRSGGRAMLVLRGEM